MKYLEDNGRYEDVTFYLRHVIWMLLVHIASTKTNGAFPSSHVEYGVVIKKIDKIIPESINNCFLRIRNMKLNNLKIELSKLLNNSIV